MHERQPDVRGEGRERLAQTVGGGLGLANEILHLRLAEVRGAGSREAAAEALDARDPHPAPVALEDRRLSLEDVDASVLEHLANGVAAIGVVVVVPEHRHDGYGRIGQFLREHLSLLWPAQLGEVAGEEEHVRAFLQVNEGWSEGPLGIRTEVQVGAGRHPDHERSSWSASASVVTVVSLWTSASGNTSCTIWDTARRRSSVGTLPVTNTFGPTIFTRSSSSPTRGSC